MEEQLIARLRSNAALALLHGVVGKRPSIDLIERPSNDQSSFPSTVISVISGSGDYVHAGPTNFNRPRVRFECFALNYADTKILSRAIRSEIDVPFSNDGVRFHRAQLQNERDFSPEKIGGDLDVFRVILDFFLPYTKE